MELDMSTVGARIRARRKELGLTQLDIKTATSISSGTISDIENGNRLPAAATLVQLALVLHCSVDWILTGNIPHQENILSPASQTAAEQTLLSGFRKLSAADQEELLEILQMKLRRTKKANGAGSSPSNPVSDGDNLAG